MKITLVKNRQAADGSWFLKWRLTLPNDLIKELGWKGKDELDASIAKGSLVIKRRQVKSPRHTLRSGTAKSPKSRQYQG